MKTTIFTMALLLTAALYAEAGVAPLRPDTIPQDTVTVKKQTDLTAQMDTTDLFKELEEVVIEGSIVQRRGNEDIWTVTEKLRKGTRNAGDLLGKLQGVTYNPVTKDIYFQGSHNVKILVDSIERDEAYIKRLGSGRFDRINVIQNPQGKYMGYDAVINLHTHRHYEGYEGTVFGELGVIPTDRPGKGNKINSMVGALDFTYTRDKWNFVVIGNLPRSISAAHQGYTKEYPLNDYVQNTLPLPGDSPESVDKSFNPFVEVSADWQINPKHSLSLTAGSNWKSSRSHVHTLMEQGAPGSQRLLTTEEWQNMSTTDYSYYGGRLQYRGELPKWGGLNGAAQLYVNSYNRPYSFEKSSGFSLTDDRHIKAAYGWATADTYHWLNPKLFFWAWAYIMYSHQSDYRLETNEELGNATQTTTMAQANFTWYPRQGISIGATVGGDLIVQKSGTIRETRVFPRLAANASWQVSKDLNLRLNYSTDASGPGAEITQNSGLFTDSLTWQGGNPDLKPVQNHRVSLSASIWRWLSVSASYSAGSNAAFRIAQAATGLRPDGIEGPYARYLWENGTRNSWNANVTMQRPVGNHWNFSLTASVSGNKATWEDCTAEKVLPNYNFMASYTPDMGGFVVLLNHQMSSGLSITPQERRWENMDQTALYLQKHLFSRSLAIGLGWVLPVHIQKGDARGGMNSDAVRIRYHYNNLRMTDNMLSLQIGYKFQGGKSVRKYSRTQL